MTMFIHNEQDFETLKANIKDGLYDGSLFICTELVVDISNIHVRHNVVIECPIKNVNFIPTRVDGKLEIKKEISFAELKHIIYCGGIEVNSLLTTKGLNCIHLTNEISDDEGPFIVRFKLSDKYNDDTLEYLPMSVINAERVYDKIFYGTTKSFERMKQFLPKDLLDEAFEICRNQSTILYLNDMNNGFCENYAYINSASDPVETFMETL